MATNQHKIFSRHTPLRYWLSCFIMASAIMFFGCAKPGQKLSQQLDDDIYAIIDGNWDDDFGSQADYQLNQTLTPAEIAGDIPNHRDTAFLAQPIDNSQPLNFTLATKLAIERSNEYQNARENLYLTALGQKDVEYLYQIIPFSNLTAGYQGQRPNDNTIIAQTDTGLEKLLANGTVINASLQTAYMNVLTGDLRSGANSILRAMITVPLLRGADRIVVLENLTQAQRNTLYAVRDFNRFRKEFIVSVASDYYRLLQAQDNMAIAAENMQVLQNFAATAATLANYGRIDRHEQQQALQDSNEAELTFIEARENYQQLLENFKLRLLIPQSQEISLDSSELQAIKDAQYENFDIELEQAIEYALNQRLDLINTSDKVIDAHRQVYIAGDALKAFLSVSGAFSPASDTLTFGANPGSLAKTAANYELLVNLDLPIDREREKNQYKRALIFLARQQRQHQILTETIKTEVQDAWRQMNENQQRSSINKNNMLLASKRLQDTQKLLRAGRASTRDVLDAQRDYIRSSNDFTANSVSYALSRLEFFSASGMLWINPNGQWQITTH